MAMLFWEAKRKAALTTTWLLICFFILAVGMALLIEWVVRILAADGYTQPMPYLGLLFLGVTCAVALFYYSLYTGMGGSYVAESLRGRLIAKDTADFKERQLLNIVEEIALASNLPVPPVYLLPAQEINAFAAGVRPKKRRPR